MKREAVVKKVWLNYFNRTLYDQGCISEQEYRKLKNKISTQYSSTSVAQYGQRGADFLLNAKQINKKLIESTEG